MEDKVRSWDLVGHFLDASVGPERLGELITLWDAQAEHAGLEQPRFSELAGSAFAHQVAGVLQILERLHAAELRRVNDLLSSMLGAAMVLAEDGMVVAANDAAGRLFGLKPGASICAMPLEPAQREAFAARVSEIAAEACSAHEDIVRLRPTGLDRAVLVHLKALSGGNGRTRVLAVTSELAWPDASTEFLTRVFKLTPAEIEIVRLLSAGGTVAGIAAATGRSTGTVRSQLHAVLQKTGTQTQAEVVRLAILLMQSVPAGAEPPRPAAPAEPRQRFLRMPDGRRIEVLSFGDPAGRPVIWMQSMASGACRAPRRRTSPAAVFGCWPFRAGWCGSDPLPQGRQPFESAVSDMRTLMLQLRISSAVVVVPGDDIHIALMLAQADPSRVRASVA